MKDRSTKTLGEYWFDCLYYLVIFGVWYDTLLFRCLPGMTCTASKTVLWAMIIVSVLTCSFVFYRRMRTNWTLSIALVIPFGLYAVLAYRQIVGMWMRVVLSVATVLAITYSTFILTRKIKNGRSLRKVIKWRIHRCCYAIQSSVAVALILVIGIIGIQSVFGDNIINSSIAATTNKQSTSQTISNNIDTVLLLQEEEWGGLTSQEKLDVLQTVANIEAHYLGLPNELNVGVANLGEYTLACYNDRTHTISIDLDHLENASVYDVLDSCCHEAYHSYQHRLVEAYHAADEQMKGLRIYKSTIKYGEEFGDYSGGDYDYRSYYYQDCEVDAREYAEEAINDYYRQIEEYLNNISNDSNARKGVVPNGTAKNDKQTIRNGKGATSTPKKGDDQESV